MNGYPVPNGKAVESHYPLAPGVKPTFRLLGPFSGAEGLPTQMIETKLQYYINPYCQLGSPAYASEFIIAINFFFDRRSSRMGQGQSFDASQNYDTISYK